MHLKLTSLTCHWLAGGMRLVFGWAVGSRMAPGGMGLLPVAWPDYDHRGSQPHCYCWLPSGAPSCCDFHCHPSYDVFYQRHFLHGASCLPPAPPLSLLSLIFSHRRNPTLAGGCWVSWCCAVAQPWLDRSATLMCFCHFSMAFAPSSRCVCAFFSAAC